MMCLIYKYFIIMIIMIIIMIINIGLDSKYNWFIIFLPGAEKELQ